MRTKKLRLINLISAIFLAVLFCLLAVFGAAGSSTVYAETAPEVLQDLRKDKDFDESTYPYKKDDYGLYVIQIAESSNKELFVYAYQPCHDTYDLVGTKISISYGYSVDGSGLTPKLYNLRLLSTSGTLDKYHVDGFTVPNDGDRYYNIVEIFRMVNTEIDEIDPSFPKTDIACSVGQQWYVCDLNDSKHYEMNTFNTLSVETVFNSHFYFGNGIQIKFLSKPAADCWFYCFNVEDYVIKHIFDATLSYSSVEVKENYSNWSDDVTVTPNEDTRKVNQTVRLFDSDVMKHSGNGLFAKTFEWNKILTSKEFIETAEKQGITIVEADKEKIKTSQWVFTYLETDYEDFESPTVIFRTEVYDVGLLQLHFQDISGKYYDLGVVNDLTDPDNVASGKSEIDFKKAFEEFWDKFVKIILTIVGVIFLLVLLKFVPLVRDIFKFIFKGVVWVISAPFKLLKSIFKKDG